MDKMRIDKGDWLVVCDGRKALILENLGDEMFPNLHTREVHEQPNPSPARKGPTHRTACMPLPAAPAARPSRPTGMMRPSAPSCEAWRAGSMPPSARARPRP